jgi:hypothetical protein
VDLREPWLFGSSGIAFHTLEHVGIHGLGHIGAQSLHAFALRPITSLCTLH